MKKETALFSKRVHGIENISLTSKLLFKRRFVVEVAPRHLA